MITSKKVVMLDGVKATSTSAIVGISAPQNISIQMVASAVSSGNGVFTVQVSNDNVNWTAYNRLTTNVTNTNAQTDLRASSVTLSADGSAIVFIPRSDVFQYMRTVCTVTTDGTYSATAYFN